jgi:hypothetical protein
MSGKLSHLVGVILSHVHIHCLAHVRTKRRPNKSHVCQNFKKLALCSRLPIKKRQGEDIAMRRKQNTEYKDLLYKSFKPAYLFSKVVGVMPLSYKINRILNDRVANKRSASATEFVWSWQSAIYSGLWIVLYIALNYWTFYIRFRHLPPVFEANSHHGNLSSENFSERGTSHRPTPSRIDGMMWVGSTNHILDCVGTILALVIGIFGTRKIPEIFRQLQHLDDNADEDGYTFLGMNDFFSPRL